MTWLRSRQAAGLAATAAGLLWIIAAVLYAFGPVGWAPAASFDYLGTVAFILAMVALMPAALGLHLQQIERSGRLGRWGFRAAFLGAGAAGIGRLLEAFGPFAAEGVIMLTGFLLYLPGLILLGVGLVLMGLATFRARVFPRWAAWAVLLGFPALLLIEFGGLFLFGLIWIAIALHLFLPRGRAARLRTEQGTPGVRR